MTTIRDIGIAVCTSYLVVLGYVALRASIIHNGPGPLELIGMLWRGEIRSKK